MKGLIVVGNDNNICFLVNVSYLCIMIRHFRPKKTDATPFLINVWVLQKDIFWLFQGNSKAKASLL